MKICIIGDIHWCDCSSIVKGRGERYSLRLENCIDSINWAEEIAKEEDCKVIVYLGDFFDRANLNAEEISALQQLDFNSNIARYFLCGNHELGRHDASFASCDILSNWGKVVKEPCKQTYVNMTNISDLADIDLIFLPYIFEEDRQPFISYIPNDNRKKIVFSHNDIKGIQMGNYKSTIGFDINEIEFNCNLFINGHLHNGSQLVSNVFNIGNLTGQNFSEDAFKYQHGIFILNTDELSIDFYENPCAFNFYKIDLTQYCSEEHIFNILNNLKNNAIVTVKCNDEDVNYVREAFAHVVTELRVVSQNNNAVVENKIEEIQTVDYLSKFIDFIHDKIESSDILNEEIGEICK